MRCLPAAGILTVQPDLQRDGWSSVMPMTALIAAIYVDNHELAFFE